MSTLTERIAEVEAKRHLPTNVVNFHIRPERRAVPRWIEWTRQHEGKDLTTFVPDGCGPSGRAA